MSPTLIAQSVAILTACAGAAIAAPTMQEITEAPRRIDPVFVTPEYFIDGVWVEGETVPYRSTSNRAYPNRKLVFDGAYAVDGPNNDWVAGADPCSGYGYLFTATTDSNAANYYTVQAGNVVHDFADMDPAAVGKVLSGFMWNWHQSGTENSLRVRIRWYDVCNTANSTTFTGTGFFSPSIANLASNGRMGVTFTYNGSIGPGNYFSGFDSDPPLFTAGSEFLDRDGALHLFAESSVNVLANSVQFVLQAPNGTAARPGSSQPIAWIDDSGELGRVSATHPYDINAAVHAGGFQITGTYATGNETYYLSGAPCFASALGASMSWWVKSCTPQQAAALSAPANGASGITNPVQLTFTPPTVLPVDFEADIMLNGHVQHAMTGLTTATVSLDTSLDAGRAYGWKIVSNAGSDCADAHPDTWMFRMVGCAPDFNVDQIVDFFDYLDFVDAFSGSQDLADFNADQIVDFFDYLDFVDAFSAGC